MAVPKVLLIGATGYIGGSVLSTLLASGNPRIQACTYTALVRKQEHVEKLEVHGVRAVVFPGLDDLDLLRQVASEHDIVVNAANAAHPSSAKALIMGLADRKRQIGGEPFLIHVSGTSSLGDRPISGLFLESRSRIFSDKDEELYAWERHREDVDPYPQRTTDVTVFETGEAAGIKTYIVMPPTIYGIGSGFFKRISIQIDCIMRAAHRDGYTSVIGSGDGQWGHVHIEDLVLFYELLLGRLLEGDDSVPCNKRGLFFNVTGHHTWREVSERIAREGKKLGYLPTDEVRERPLDECASKFTGGPPSVVELAFSSHIKTQPDLALELGWAPRKTRADFEASFVPEWHEIAKEAAAKV
ncbi:NAD dependent epimerase/dehydratase family protein [Thozetella sp. PMI_491]|nr:NAD dependent epimerase/dehydratase family protein [Thozetella sp. PMI_491]